MAAEVRNRPVYAECCHSSYRNTPGRLVQSLHRCNGLDQWGPLLVGAEVLGMAAIAVMGKDGYAYLKKKGSHPVQATWASANSG